MPPRADSGKQQRECWECLRRCLACDGRRPVCECCHSAGIVCPGYEDRRPLTWVTPGNITVTRIRRAGTTSASTKNSAAFKKRCRRERPQLLSPPSEEASTRRRPKETITASNNDGDKATEDGNGPYSTSSGDNGDDEDDNDAREKGDRDEEAVTVCSNQLQSTKMTATTPQPPATSLTVVPSKRRQSVLNEQQSASCIPISLQLDEFELMEAVEYCMSIRVPTRDRATLTERCRQPSHIPHHQLQPSNTQRFYKTLRQGPSLPAHNLQPPRPHLHLHRLPHPRRRPDPSAEHQSARCRPRERLVGVLLSSRRRCHGGVER